MKNEEVPLWDKGDDTDNFAKGGGRSARGVSLEGVLKADKDIEKAFKVVLGRKPSTREGAYYRISRMKWEDIVLKLVSGEEHKELIKNAKKYPKILEENKQQKGTILKLKSEHESRVKEYEDLNQLLKEKNKTIKELRETKDKPFITNPKIMEESTTYHSKYKQRTETNQGLDNERTAWDKIIDLFFK